MACCSFWVLQAEETPRFRVATFQSEVTLPLGDLLYSEPLATVEHPLLAKGIVLDDGGKRYVLCAVDWCTMHNSTHLMFQSKLAAAAGGEVAHVAVQCVHQHTAPSFDGSAEELLKKQKNPPQHRNLKSLEEITDRLADAVTKSLDALEPFDCVGLGQAKVDRVASIRRVITPEGKLLTRWSACKDPELRAMPEGNIDPMLKTITLARGEKPLVRMHYYATHPQTYYRDGRASYDFPGMARQRLQEEEGVFQIYFTGCSGDVTAGKYNDGTPEAREELAQRLFAGMKASVASTRLSPVEQLQWRTVPVQFTARTDADRDSEESRSVLENPEGDPDARSQAAGRIACFERLKQPIELSALGIGPARIVHLPGEPMIEFQHFAQGLLPGGFVAVAGYGIGTPGYVCTERAFEEGGYEPSASAVVPQSEEVVKTAIRQLLAVE
ncbi:MAG: hypothetical protein A2V98_25430 [Planctomycetes bacterium RBG_16_64_12]|nr:MAG: hypothetical protein A2V98_25430 [Planctomycetes bacterium RBG_16_64_12]